MILESIEYSDRKLKRNTHSSTHTHERNNNGNDSCGHQNAIIFKAAHGVCGRHAYIVCRICTQSVHTRKNSTIKTIGNEFLGDTRFDRLLLKYVVVRLDFQILLMKAIAVRSECVLCVCTQTCTRSKAEWESYRKGAVNKTTALAQAQALFTCHSFTVYSEK